LRLADVDVGQHPSSYGFPAGYPPMGGFLGVPVVIRGEVRRQADAKSSSSRQVTA